MLIGRAIQFPAVTKERRISHGAIGIKAAVDEHIDIGVDKVSLFIRQGVFLLTTGCVPANS